MKEKIKKNFGTNEWSTSSTNIQNGCQNSCKYCYASALAIRFKKKSAETWKHEEVNLSKVNKQFKKKEGRIMFPTSHDLNLDNIEYAIIHLRNILKVGNQVLVVSKPKIEVITRLCSEFSEFKSQILFRFSIGSTSSETLSFWEPGASSYEERKQCLIFAFNHGFATSVSSEPLLEMFEDNAVDLVHNLEPFITDALWIGKANSLIRSVKINGFNDVDTLNFANQLMKSQSDDFFNNLYNQLSLNPKVKWKSSVKKIVGLEISDIKGSDI